MSSAMTPRPPANDQGIGTYVRYWLHYGNLASSFFKQYNTNRNIRDDYERQLITHLQQTGMEKATIQTSQGIIRVADKREPNPLSLSKMEEMIQGYFRQRGGKDETQDLMRYIRTHRGYVVSKVLKQSATPAAAAAAAPNGS